MEYFFKHCWLVWPHRPSNIADGTDTLVYLLATLLLYSIVNHRKIKLALTGKLHPCWQLLCHKVLSMWPESSAITLQFHLLCYFHIGPLQWTFKKETGVLLHRKFSQLSAAPGNIIIHFFPLDWRWGACFSAVEALVTICSDCQLFPNSAIIFKWSSPWGLSKS